MSRISDFFSGASHLLKGFRFLFAHPSLWVWALIPWALSVLILAVSWGFFIHTYPDFYQFLLAHIGLGESVRQEGFWDALAFAGFWTLKQILKLFLFLLGLTLLSIVAFVLYLILSAPFCDLLAEKVTKLSQGIEAAPSKEGRFFKSILQTIGVESKKAVLFLIFPILFSLLALIPVIGGFIYVVLTFSFGMWALGFISIDYPMGHKRMPFKERLQWARKNKFALIGFGLPFLIPFAPLLLQAPMVVGGTLLYHDLMQATFSEDCR